MNLSPNVDLKRIRSGALYRARSFLRSTFRRFVAWDRAHPVCGMVLATLLAIVSAYLVVLL